MLDGISDVLSLELLCGADMDCQSGTTGYTCGESDVVYQSWELAGTQCMPDLAGELTISSSSGLRVTIPHYYVL